MVPGGPFASALAEGEALTENGSGEEVELSFHWILIGIVFFLVRYD